MYIVVNKDTGEYIKDTGVSHNTNKDNLYNNLLSMIDKKTEDIIYVENNSPFIKAFEAMFESQKRFKVQVEDKQVVGITII